MLVAGSCAATPEETTILDIERLFAAPDLDGPSPRAVRISPDSTRVTFLRGKDTDPLQMDLWEFNIADKAMRLLVDSVALTGDSEELSEEELARRERLRIVGQKGIVSYQFSPDGKRLLFPLNGDLYLYEIATGDVSRLTSTEQGETDPKFSNTGRYVSFVREQNLYVIEIDAATEQQITTDGGGTIRNGMAEFIAQEEMDRYTGYWWSPDDRELAFTRVDESPVDVVERFEVYAEDFKVYEQRYPATGTPNVLIQVGVASLDGGDIRWMDIGDETDIYVARVDWFPDGAQLAVQRQSRDQQRLDLLKIETATGASKVLLTETSDTWLNLHNDLTFLEESPQFIWLSERSGHAHLYLYRNDGHPVRQISDGEWDVVDGARARRALLHVDEASGLLYFTATVDSPMERNVYRLPLSGGTSPQRITTTPGWHQVDFADNGEFFVDSYNSIDTPPQVSIHRASGERISYIQENALDEAHPYFPFLAARPSTEFGTLQAADGHTLYYSMKKPSTFDANRKYPVVLLVYGGPQGQRITNKWSAGFEDVLTRSGFIVFSVDNRGTGFRGTDFDAPIYRRMGHVEVQDQLVGVNFLRSLEFVDDSRIGVFGWSYGGYMTLMTMLQAPELFAAGVSGAPVTDWTLYDTHYTERYLGTPENNAAGYEASSVFPYVKKLSPPLLLIHGMADDNVLFTNSTKLMHALQANGLDFDLMTYPGSKHSLLRVPSTGVHGYKKILQFLQLHLSGS
ncbi:MAG: S9 family peptidase [Gammaproteobacteria bacterium]|nr:S9 family peptidase [Gammaproteobacteria bacterium]